MRIQNLALTFAALLACACAPTRLQQHWGETSRATSRAQIEAAKAEPARGLDGAGAEAAAGNYKKSLVSPTKANTPPTLIQVGQSE
jgi:hypothetical protein